MRVWWIALSLFALSSQPCPVTSEGRAPIPNYPTEVGAQG